jgi:uncharacterized membrane protein YfcA
MQMTLATLAPLLLGMLSGTLLGLTGAGGAIIAVPLLVFGLGMPMVAAAPVALLATAIGAGTGALLGLRQGILRYKAAAVMSACGLLLSPLGLWAAGYLPNQPLVLLFSLVLFYVSISMFLRAKQPPPIACDGAVGPPCLLDQTRGKLTWTLPCFRAMLTAGGSAGLLSGLLGVGGGFVIVPALRKVTDLPMRSIVATSMGVIAIVSIGSVLGATLEGTMHWRIGVPFAAGAFVGLLLGRWIGHRLDHHVLQRVFAAFAFIVACAMLTKAVW